MCEGGIACQVSSQQPSAVVSSAQPVPELRNRDYLLPGPSRTRTAGREVFFAADGMAILVDRP